MFPHTMYPSPYFPPTFWPPLTPSPTPTNRPRQIEHGANLLTPLLSLEARGTIGGTMTYRMSNNRPQAMSKPPSHEPITAQERATIHQLAYLAAAWGNLPLPIRNLWRNDASRGLPQAYRRYIINQTGNLASTHSTADWNPIPPTNPYQPTPAPLLTPLPMTIAIEPPPAPPPFPTPDTVLILTIALELDPRTDDGPPPIAILLPPNTSLYTYPEPLPPGVYAVHTTYVTPTAPRRFAQQRSLAAITII